MTVTAVNADAPTNDEERALVAEFEASLPIAMRTQLGLAKLWDRIGLLAEFTAETLARLDKIQTQLMRRVFDRRDRSILVDGDVHPLIDKATGRPVPLVDDWDDLVAAALWAMRVDPIANDRRIAEGHAINAMCRWLRWNVLCANRVASGVCTFVRVFVELPDDVKQAYLTLYRHQDPPKKRGHRDR